MEDVPRRFNPVTFLVGFGAGTFVGVALALLATALVDDTTATNNSAAVRDAAAANGVITTTPESRPKTKSALDVRLGPDTSYAIIGLLSRGETVEPVGRDADAKWLAIRFPPGSAGRGWVPISELEGATGIDRLAVALPTPLPRAVPDFPLGIPESFGTAVATPEGPLVTPTPQFNPGPPDLFVSRVLLLSDGRVSVTVGNRGPGDLVGQAVFVIVRDLGARSEQLVSGLGNLRVGGTITLVTSSFRVTSDEGETIQAIADPYDNADDVNRSNNLMQVTLVPLPRTPTPVPTPEPQGE